MNKIYTSPKIELIREDFPDPMGPTTPTKLPGLIESVISCNT